MPSGVMRREEQTITALELRRVWRSMSNPYTTLSVISPSLNAPKEGLINARPQ
jgi:hypothetical protein